MRKVRNILTILEIIFLALALIVFVMDMLVWIQFIHSSMSFYFLFAAGLMNIITRIISDPDSITFKRKED